MNRQLRQYVTLIMLALSVFTGCHPTQPFYFHEDGDLSHYLHKAIEPEYADVDHQPIPEVQHVLAPLTVSNPDFREFWELTLEEAVSIALQNSKTIRSISHVSSFGFSNALSVSPANGLTPFNQQQVRTVYDVAIQDTAVESALAEFDAVFSIVGGSGGGDPTQNRFSSAINDRGSFSAAEAATFTNRPNNVVANAFQTNITQNDNYGVRSQLMKKSATGASFAVFNDTDYSYTHNLSGIQALRSTWTTSFGVVASMPLLRGRGTQVNRANIILSRIDVDQNLSQFEGAVRNLVMDVENAYWDLYLAFRQLETTKTARDSAHGTWKIVYTQLKFGNKSSVEEAQARGQFFAFEAQTQQALDGVFNRESHLRYVMGLTATDGRVIRPAEEPVTGQVRFDHNEVIEEMLARSPELRNIRWELKSNEIQLIVARNQLLPDLNAFAQYRWVGVGDNLMNASRNGLNFPAAGSTAFDELTEGNYQEAGIGFSFAMPVGFRRAMAGVRAAQMSLARNKALLEDEELAETHIISETLRVMNGHYVRSQTYLQQWIAANDEVRAKETLFEGGKETLDQLLDAQRRRSQAQNDYYTAVAEYNKWLAQVHFRKGSLLEHDGVSLSEGPWPEKAYWDALGRARARDASYYLDYGWSRPRVISQGPVHQQWGDTSSVPANPMVPQAAAPAVPEREPTPATPAQPENQQAEPGPITYNFR